MNIYILLGSGFGLIVFAVSLAAVREEILKSKAFAQFAAENKLDVKATAANSTIYDIGQAKPSAKAGVICIIDTGSPNSALLAAHGIY